MSGCGKRIQVHGESWCVGMNMYLDIFGYLWIRNRDIDSRFQGEKSKMDLNLPEKFT